MGGNARHTYVYRHFSKNGLPNLRRACGAVSVDRKVRRAPARCGRIIMEDRQAHERGSASGKYAGQSRTRFTNAGGEDASRGDEACIGAARVVRASRRVLRQWLLSTARAWARSEILVCIGAHHCTHATRHPPKYGSVLSIQMPTRSRVIHADEVITPTFGCCVRVRALGASCWLGALQCAPLLLLRTTAMGDVKNHWPEEPHLSLSPWSSAQPPSERCRQSL